jgi:DNA-binding transcriptional MerR regulator
MSELITNIQKAVEELKEMGVRDAADMLYNVVKHEHDEGNLTLEVCYGVILTLNELYDFVDASTEEEKKYFHSKIVQLMNDVPLYAGVGGMAIMISKIKDEELNDWIAPILFSVRNAGFTYKGIKGFMNQYLEQDEREKLGEIIRENKEEVEEWLEIAKVTDKLAEAFNDAGVENGEEWTVERAQSEAVEALAAASEALVSNKGEDFGGSIVFDKGGHRIMMPMIFSNQKEKDRFRKTAQGVSRKLNPDAVILVTDTFTSPVPKEGLDKKSLAPSEDPNRGEAILVAVETPNSKWQALQHYERDEDNNITLTELVEPQRQDDIQGDFVFMQNA